MQKRHLAAALVALAAYSPCSAKDIYVSSSTGKNDNDGSKAAPKKLLWRVLNELAPGDHVYVAEGRQEGQSGCGTMPKCAVPDVTIEGGWKADFSERDPFKYLTFVGPAPDQGGTAGTIFRFEGIGTTLDGFCLDRGETNCYFSDGEPGANKRIEGHKDNSPWGYRELNRKVSGSHPTVEMEGKGGFTIRNCILLNNPWWAIYVKCGGAPGTKVTIENNLILISQSRAIEAITGGGWGQPTILIKNNTIAFNHTIKSTEGRALCVDPKPTAAKYVIENNVLCYSDGGGIDTKFPSKGDSVTLTNNLFYFNRRGDVAVGDEKGTHASTMGDDLEFKNSGNVHELPKFVAKLAPEWVDRWSQRELIDMCAGKFNKPEQIAATREALGLKEFKLAGYDKTYPDYKSLPGKRPNYDMSRYPHPLKHGEQFDWAKYVLPAIGADAPRGVLPFTAAK